MTAFFCSLNLNKLHSKSHQISLAIFVLDGTCTGKRMSVRQYDCHRVESDGKLNSSCSLIENGFSVSIFALVVKSRWGLARVRHLIGPLSLSKIASLGRELILLTKICPIGGDLSSFSLFLSVNVLHHILKQFTNPFLSADAA